MVTSSTSSSGPPELELADGFTAPTHEQWQQHVEKVLRKSGWLTEDAPTPDVVEDVLATRTYDGVTVHPLYTADQRTPDPGLPGLAPFVRGGRPQGGVAEGWDVRQLHADPDVAATNREILADLHNGVTSLWLQLGQGGPAVAELPRALDGVYLNMINVVLDAGEEFAPAAQALLDTAADQDVPPSALHGNLGIDPLGTRARTGKDIDDGEAVRWAHRCAEGYPGLTALVADGLPYHDAGGSDAEELGAALAVAVTYLRRLTESGLDVDTAANLVEFRYAATVDQFTTIAKLRAARRLWERVTRACGVSESARGQSQHAVTSAAMLTRRDPWVNILRSTIAAFAAGVGGAQAVTVRPFDSPIGLPDPFARRVARNTQALLLDESHLAQVIDPAGGSWYVEALTDELAQSAWQWFQTLERSGGMPAALDSGLVADQLARTWQQRRDALAHREDPITGVSEFPNLDEEPLRRRPAPEPAGGGLERHRYAEDYERLRDLADEQLAETGARPRVFLATLGPIAAHTARASFARNLFAAGGFATPDAGATESTDDVLAAYAEAPAPVVCLCSGDRIYAERAAETAQALKRAGAERVLLAGKPGDHPPSHVDDFVFAGCDAVAALRDVHDRTTQTTGARTTGAPR